MPTRAQFIQQTLESLRKTVESTELLINQLSQNMQKGADPEQIVPAIGTLRKYVTGMSRSVDTIEEILAADDGDGPDSS